MSIERREKTLDDGYLTNRPLLFRKFEKSHKQDRTGDSV